MLHRPLAALVALLLARARPRPRAAETTSGAAAVHLLGWRRDDAAPAFPVTVEADNGSVTLEEEPDAVVSLSATATESLFAIGAGEQVIAVDDQSNFPADAPVTDLSGFQPNVEAIAGYEPDLVIAAYDPGGLVEGLETLDIPVLLQDAAPDLDAAYDADRDARRGHRKRRRSRDRRRVDADRDRGTGGSGAGRRRRHRLPRARAGLLHGHLGHVHRQRLRAVRLVNIADAADDADAGGYPQLSGEYIVSESPDVIVLADTKCCEQTAETVAGRPGWDQVDGGRQRRHRRGGRRHRLALGAAHRRLRRADRRRRSRASEGRSGECRGLRAPCDPAGAGGPGLARWALAAGAFVLLATLLGLALGPVDLGLAAVVREVLEPRALPRRASRRSPRPQDAILWELRAPRVALGLLVGAMLASAGAPIRASSATRSPTRTCSAPQPGPASARRS